MKEFYIVYRIPFLSQVKDFVKSIEAKTKEEAHDIFWNRHPHYRITRVVSEDELYQPQG